MRRILSCLILVRVLAGRQLRNSETFVLKVQASNIPEFRTVELDAIRSHVNLAAPGLFCSCAAWAWA